MVFTYYLLHSSQIGACVLVMAGGWGGVVSTKHFLKEARNVKARGRLWERVEELSVFEKCFCVLIFLKKGTEGNPVFPSACFYVFVERKAELTCSAQ